MTAPIPSTTSTPPVVVHGSWCDPTVCALDETHPGWWLAVHRSTGSAVRTDRAVDALHVHVERADEHGGIEDIGEVGIVLIVKPGFAVKADPPHWVCGEIGLDLTIAEAQQLVAALTEQIAIAQQAEHP